MHFVAIAIDGPAASGKSSVARRVAEHFGFLFINSGAMYRAFTWWVLENRVNPSDATAVLSLLQRSRFECGLQGRESIIRIDGRAVTEDFMRREDVNASVSTIAAIPEVRRALVAQQQHFCSMGDLVMEGRDIGTVVIPETPYKFYLDASAEVRVRRRRAQGIDDNIRDRDLKDSSRDTAPLRPADDAQRIDTSHLTLEEVTEKVIQTLHVEGVRRREPPRQVMSWVYNLTYALCKAFFGIAYAMEVHHAERARIPGGAYFASNHASFLDPPLVGTALEEPIFYLARNTLFKPPIFSWLLPRLNTVPVDRDNAELSSLRVSMQIVKEGKKMVVFPEGTRTPDGSLQPAQRGVGMLVAKTGVPVIPVRIFGSFEAFPRTSKFPKLDGKIHVVFGHPIHFSEEELTAKGKAGQQVISDRVMQAIASLTVPDGTS
ncbi:MAG: Cytidylate kinase/1-acyl-sn-glycerol-3-phosphate acyltransferase [Verrucomicrobia bacterium]|nr:MAG: Cytidylate kinase/1-acyl-sn-glycerol-3-phosphate acyltransferase [Verrucomicrobiota bacterium]